MIYSIRIWPEQFLNVSVSLAELIFAGATKKKYLPYFRLLCIILNSTDLFLYPHPRHWPTERRTRNNTLVGSLNLDSSCDGWGGKEINSNEKCIGHFFRGSNCNLKHGHAKDALAFAINTWGIERERESVSLAIPFSLHEMHKRLWGSRRLRSVTNYIINHSDLLIFPSPLPQMVNP